MSESSRPARFICYPNGDVEDVQQRAVLSSDGAANHQPPKRPYRGASTGRTAAGGTVGLLLVITLLRVFQSVSDREPNHDDPTGPYRDRVGNMPPNPYAARQAADAMQIWVDRQQPSPRVDPITAAVTLLDRTQKLLTDLTLALDRAGNDPRLNPTAERSLDKADEALDRVEDVLCRCVADGPPPLASPAVDSLLGRLADLRERTTLLRLRIRISVPPVPIGDPTP
jgi:hypothetical protein